MPMADEVRLPLVALLEAFGGRGEEARYQRLQRDAGGELVAGGPPHQSTEDRVGHRAVPPGSGALEDFGDVADLPEDLVHIYWGEEHIRSFTIDPTSRYQGANVR